MAEHECVEVKRVVLPCENCRGPVEFIQWDGREWTMTPHYYCNDPVVKLKTHNPKKLGVVSSR